MTAAYKRYALAAMTLVYTVNLIDRGLITLLLQPVKEDLRLTDTQLGLLSGIAFGLFYATLGLPIARWADRGNRVTIMSLAIGLWSMTIMTCLFVTSFIQLVFARVAAGVGESGCKPPTYSLVGDYFPTPAERTRALSIYSISGPLSSLVSLIAGGWLNELYGWRITFFLMGVPGLLLAVLVKWTIAEPRELEGPGRARAHSSPPFKEVLAALWNQRSLRHLSAALILVYTLGLGLGPWFAAFLIRSHGMAMGELGVWLGLIFGFGGIVGSLAGGALANRCFVHDEKAQMRMSAATIALTVPCFVAFLTLSQKYPVLAALMLLYVMLFIFYGPTYALMQRLVRDEMRATMLALVMLLANLIGFGIGPQTVGILSDLLQPVFGADSLRYAMLVMSLVGLWSAYHFWQVARHVKRDLAAVEFACPVSPCRP